MMLAWDRLRLGSVVCRGRAWQAFVAIWALMIGLILPHGAAHADWREVGSRNFASIGGTISVPVNVNSPIKALRLVNRGMAITITNVRVIYGDRSTFTDARRFTLRTGERTRVFATLPRGKPVSSVVVSIDAASVPSAQGRLVILGDVDIASARPPEIAAVPPPAARPIPDRNISRDREEAARQSQQAQRLDDERRRVAIEVMRQRQEAEQKTSKSTADASRRREDDARVRAQAEAQTRAADEQRRVAELQRRFAEERMARERESSVARRVAPPSGGSGGGYTAPSAPPPRPSIALPKSAEPPRGPAANGQPRIGASRGVTAPPTADSPKPLVPAVPPMDSLGQRGTGDGGGGSGIGRIGAAPPPPPPAAAPAPITRAPAPEAPAAAAPEPAPATAPQAEWDIVPVFYGTDRALETNPKRVQYGADRGRRLQLGRALVTVPKAHQVPNVERPWALTIPYLNITLYQEKEDPRRHFTIKEIRELSRAEFLDLVRKRLGASVNFKDHALVFVHGFNNTFDAATYRTAQMAYDLTFDGAPFQYSWPSKGALGATDYSYDRESAGQAEPHFRSFMEMVVKETGAKHISVVAHSMGNQLLLATLRSLKPSMPEGVTLNQIILAAPDVDRDSFEFLAKEVMGVGRGMTLLAAGNDRALEISRRFWGGVPRAGDVPEAGPVVVPGIDTIDITAMSTAMFALNHSGYAEKTALLDDIRQLIQSGQRPPSLRVPNLLSIDTPKGPFWRYPAK